QPPLAGGAVPGGGEAVAAGAARPGARPPSGGRCGARDPRIWHHAGVVEQVEPTAADHHRIAGPDDRGLVPAERILGSHVVPLDARARLQPPGAEIDRHRRLARHRAILEDVLRTGAVWIERGAAGEPVVADAGEHQLAIALDLALQL